MNVFGLSAFFHESAYDPGLDTSPMARYILVPWEEGRPLLCRGGHRRRIRGHFESS
jgi:hypothetical protein